MVYSSTLRSSQVYWNQPRQVGCLGSFFLISLFSLQAKFQLKRCIKYERQCLIIFSNTSNFPKILRCASYINLYSQFLKCDVTLSLVFDILHTTKTLKTQIILKFRHISEHSSVDHYICCFWLYGSVGMVQIPNCLQSGQQGSTNRR